MSSSADRFPFFSSSSPSSRQEGCDRSAARRGRKSEQRPAGPGWQRHTDTMNNSSSTQCEPVHQAANSFFMMIYSLIFLVGLVLNGFTLRVYFCVSRRRASSSVTVFLKNLAASDFLISLCLPLRIINFSSNSTLIRQVYCNFGASAFYLNMYASILFMGYIAANRYMKIVHPLGNHFIQKARPAYILSALTWGFLLTMTSSYVILSLLTQTGEENLPGLVSCDVLHSHQLRLLYKVVHTCSAAIFLAVLTSLIGFYRSTSRRLAQAQQNQPISSNSKKLARSRRNMLVLVSVFCLCFVPYHLVRLPYAFMKQLVCSWRGWFFYLKELTVLVSVLNVCLDPLIYFIFCKAFRAQMTRRRVSNNTDSPTQPDTTDRRSSDGWRNSIRNLRKMSVVSLTKQTSVL